ncbi:MAG TPA: DUF3857 and transglutaminase domain-containing protein [Verrucomicrobiae bacterium]|nr:DUF3857 and transglutaminase domain-containing protein [Verrucomicrobiae bacterium]
MTTARSFSRAGRTRAIEAGHEVLLLAAALLLFPTVAKAGGIPDWFRAAAQDKLPNYPADTKAVQLLDDLQVVVKDNGDVEDHYRCVFRILRPEGIENLDFVGVGYSNESKILLFKGWTITPTGQEIEVSDKDVTEMNLSSFEVYSDYKEKVIRFPSAAVGSVVGYEYIRKVRPFTFDEAWYFQAILPNHRSRISLQLPPGWEYEALWANMPEQKPETPGPNEYVWEVMDSPGIEIEPEMPPPNTIAAHMFLKYFPANPSLPARATGSWQEIGAWSWGLTGPMRIATPEIKAKVAELTAGKTDTLDKIRALADYVQSQIRYAAIEIGIGGWQPHAAGDVFLHQYGDCKDKATLLNTMLGVIGVESYNVAINTWRGVTDPKFPTNSFDHEITAIRIPDDVPGATLYALVQDPQLGRLLFFDPTDEYVPLGYLPPPEQDSYGLVYGADGGELIHTPTLPPSTNRLLRIAKLTLSPTGNLTGEFRELMWGGPAEKERAEFLETKPADRAKIMEGFLGSFLDNFTLLNASIGNLNSYGENLTVNYQVAVNNYAKSAGDLLIIHPRVVGEKSSGILSGKERKYPIEFPEATRQDDVFDFTLPAGYTVDELPQPVKAECEYGSYQSHVEVTGNTLEYKRTYEINSIVVPTAKLPEVRDFFQEIAADEKSSVILKKTSP